MTFLEKLRTSLTTNSLSLSFPHCLLRQCGTEAPRSFTGTGFVEQLPDGSIQLKMFATEKMSTREQAARLFPEGHTPGVLLPDTAYYDLEATDQAGFIWKARKQSIREQFGVGNEVHARLRDLEKFEELGKPGDTRGAGWFIPGEFELPWHQTTKTERSSSVDRFEFDDELFGWKAHKVDGGLELNFTVKQSAPLEPSATRFLRATSMLLGCALEPLYSYTIGNGELVTRIHAPGRKVRSRLSEPVPTSLFKHEHAHRFLACCMHNADQAQPKPQDQLRILYAFWYRILRAHQEDIENSSLVLSVAIEGVAKTLCHSEHDTDTEFAALLEVETPIIEALEINERIRKALLASLGNAAFPKPKDTLKRLVEQGAISEAHVSAWNKMRNTGAHGALLNDAGGKFQAHLNRYFTCLDLFYRLMFVAIGYSGKHYDFSAEGWPEANFPPDPSPTPSC